MKRTNQIKKTRKLPPFVPQLASMLLRFVGLLVLDHYLQYLQYLQ